MNLGVNNKPGISAAKSSGGASNLDVNVTPVVNGTAGRLFFESAGNVLAQSANLFFDATNGRLSVRSGSSPSATIDFTAETSDDNIGFRFRNNLNTFNLVAIQNNGVFILNAQSGLGFDVVGNSGAFGNISNAFRATMFDSSFQIGHIIRSGYNQMYIEIAGNGAGTTTYNKAINILGNNNDRRAQFVSRGNLVIGNYSTFEHFDALKNTVGSLILQNSAVVPFTDLGDAGQLYVEAGALKFRGSEGTVTTIANA